MLSLTLNLPEPVYRYLQQIAAATQRPMEQLAEQSLVGNLPPSVTAMPAAIQRDLLALQMAPVKVVKQTALGQIAPAQQARHLDLLERGGAGALSPVEREELAALRLAADHLMLQKAYAWAILRWRGQPVPELDEIPLESA